MTTANWFLGLGALLLTMGFSAASVRKLPLTTSMIYLAIGLVIGPTLLNAFHFNPLQQSPLLEIVTEVAVLLSLFAAGMKMPVPVTRARWRRPVLLAFVSMSITVGVMALFGHYALGMSVGAAVLLGAILAPTDPVLASDIAVRHPGDQDRLRFSLTCEAGMNDGTAFPFVMLGLGLLGLHELGSFGTQWLLQDLLWATVAAIGLGIAGGVLVAHGAWALRQQNRDHDLLDDFLGLGLIGTVYGLSLYLHAWGFLAVFSAAVALRQTEYRLTGRAADPAQLQTPAVNHPPARRISESSLAFKEQLERLAEVVLVLLVGCTLFVDSWSWRAVGTALFLMLLARPLAVLATLSLSRTPLRIRLLSGWFGVRGIGSLYYLMFAIEHGLDEALALELIHLTLIVITLSILLHGVTVRPLLRRYARV